MISADALPPGKQAYYKGCGLPRTLAARYYRELAGARRILDLGCGAGDFGRFRPSPEVEVFGVDADPLAVELASRYERAVQADLEREPLPFADATFDGVLAKDIFEHLREPGNAVREAFRVLRPGGVLVASVVMARPSRVWADYTHVRGFTREAARLLLEDAGFVVEAIWRMGPVPLSDRLRFTGAVPALLRFPPFDWLWGVSWELRARK
jgi:SAM-dependent methyltransferase